MERWYFSTVEDKHFKPYRTLLCSQSVLELSRVLPGYLNLDLHLSPNSGTASLKHIASINHFPFDTFLEKGFTRTLGTLTLFKVSCAIFIYILAPCQAVKLCTPSPNHLSHSSVIIPHKLIMTL